MTRIVQCELRSSAGDGRILVTWLDADKKLKRGDRLTLKDMPDVWWTIQNVGQEHDRSDLKHGWGMTDFIGPIPKFVNPRSK